MNIPNSNSQKETINFELQGTTVFLFCYISYISATITKTPCHTVELVILFIANARILNSVLYLLWKYVKQSVNQ